MDDELELGGMKLVQSMRFMSETLRREQEKVEELTSSLSSATREAANQKSQLAGAKEESDTIKAQLQLRTDATQRLEKDNASLRDSIAKLSVQLDSSNLERQRLLEKCEMVESERLMWKTKCQQLEKCESEHSSLKNQCYYQQNHIRTLINQASTQYELLQKDHSKLERCVQEVQSFAKMVAENAQVQSTLLERALKTNVKLEKELIDASVTLANLRKEREELCEANKGVANGFSKEGGNYIEQWKIYQEEMTKRVDGLVQENKTLVQELNMARTLQKKLGVDDREQKSLTKAITTELK